MILFMELDGLTIGESIQFSGGFNIVTKSTVIREGLTCTIFTTD